MFSKKIATMILGLSAALLTGCEAEQTEKDMIAEAQFCMDKATDAVSAKACVDKIAGLTSPQSYTLRCAAGFIAADVTDAANLSKALQALSSNGSGATTMLTVLNFKNDKDLADETAKACNKSGQKGLALIGALAKSSTALAYATDKLGFASCGADMAACQNSIEQAIDQILLTPTAGAAPETLIAVGESIQSVYTATCGGTSVANTSICDDINQAAINANIPDIAGADIDVLAQALLAQWKKP